MANSKFIQNDDFVAFVKSCKDFRPSIRGNRMPCISNQYALEHPLFVVFNRRIGSLTDTNTLHVKAGEVRIFFGNAGPNLASSFHVVGAVFDKLYREGDLVSAPARSVAVTLVPPAGTAVVDIKFDVPGSYKLMDHSIFRTEQGALGTINVQGPPRPDLYKAFK